MPEKLETLTREIRNIPDGVNEVLRETLGDYRHREEAREKRDFRKDITVWLLIVLLASSFFYYQWSFKNFVSQYDFETTITQEVDALDGGTAINNNGGDLNVPSIPNNNQKNDAAGQ